MTEVEQMALEWKQGLACHDCQILERLIYQVAERTREEDQKYMEVGLAGVVATHPWLHLPNLRENKWEDEEA